MVNLTKIRELLADGKKYLEISQATGASSATIAKVAKDMRQTQAVFEDPDTEIIIPKDPTPVEKSVDILSSVDELYAWSKELSRLCKAFKSPHCKNYEMAYQRLRAWKSNHPAGGF